MILSPMGLKPKDAETTAEFFCRVFQDAEDMFRSQARLAAGTNFTSAETPAIAAYKQGQADAAKELMDMLYMLVEIAKKDSP